MCNIFEKRDLTDTFCAQYIYLKQPYNSKSCVAKFREFTGFSIFRRLQDYEDIFQFLDIWDISIQKQK